MKTINLRIKNKNVRVNTWGKAKNEKIVFLHGLGGSSLSFIELAEELKQDYYIVAPDLPGHGLTESFDTKEEYEIPNIIVWLNSVINQLVNEKCNIIAHSWGADIALHYLSKYRNRINKVVLLDGGYHDKLTCNRFFTEYNKQSGMNKEISSMQEEINYYLDDFDNYIFDTLEDAVETELSNYDRRTQLLEVAAKDLIKYEGGKYRWHSSGQTAKYAIMSMYKNPTRNVFSKISDNVLLLYCSINTSDAWIDLRKKLLLNIKSKSNIKTIMIEKSGHMIHWDNPDDVIKNVLNFIE